RSAPAAPAAPAPAAPADGAAGGGAERPVDPPEPPAPRMDRPRAARARRPTAWIAAGAALIAALGLAAAVTRSRAPSVERSSVQIDAVKRGPLVREVQGKGVLVPESLQWITAPSAARVDKVLVQPGASVEPDTVIVVLANPDIELQAIEAEREVARASAQATDQETSLESQKLALQSTILGLEHDLEDARRRRDADDALAEKGFLSTLERDRSREKVKELEGRIAIEKRRVSELARGASARGDAERAEVERLRAMADFRKRAVANLVVRAGARGVVQELPLQPGQSIEAGALVAKIAEPGRLRAELRIPEVQAKDLQTGQPATIDTHGALVSGKVARVDPSAQNGSVKVDVALEGTLPSGLRADLSIDGTIELERMADVVYIARPAAAAPESNAFLFKVAGDDAQRTRVRLGRASVRAVVVEEGLAPGDQVIVSDTSALGAAERIRLR
ncbi:MAG: HlyD family efflux transporter periplasmic adaptor subunit, partial [Polyangiaceae bacterium]|nr:HlyD family efflux transporter periplasmic adaptor subunit [Polyangiaceae bacterium]